MFSTISPYSVQAATAPNLGTAIGYSVFGNAGITETIAQLSHLWGNAGGNGFGNASLIASQVDGSIDVGANPSVVGAISTAYGNLASEVQTGSINLATSPTVGPGVYDVAATAFNSTLTLNGAGVYIFRSTSSIAQSAGGTMILTNGATACNVFWQIPTSMTFAGAPANIEGTIITNTGLISFVSGISLKGRAWAATQVTMSNNQITEPTCTAPSTPNRQPATITVVKTIINDNGGNKVVSDFPLFVNGSSVISGVTNTFQAPGPIFTITETPNSNYARTFSGDCDTNGQLNLIPGDNKICVITNNDIGPSTTTPPIPPLINVVKTASPLSLPNGPGLIKYTYTLSNIGQVPVTKIEMLGDTCDPIVLSSGDNNNDKILDKNEVWVYNCSKIISATHTNVVTTTGWANGIMTTDVARATVVVGAPIIAPLIHIVKKPSVFTTSYGRTITYTYTVTNPGIVPLSNVSVSDDKCTGIVGRVIGNPGDLNKNNILENNESWSFTCKSRLYQTTTNVGTARGSANGITATDFAIATVVVTNPKLPTTGFPPKDNRILIVLAGIIIASLAFYARNKNKIV